MRVREEVLVTLSKAISMVDGVIDAELEAFPVDDWKAVRAKLKDVVDRAKKLMERMRFRMDQHAVGAAHYSVADDYDGMFKEIRAIL